MTGNPILLAVVAAVMFAVLGGVTLLAHIYNLNNIKSKTVGDGQHGTARWATAKEIRQTYAHHPKVLRLELGMNPGTTELVLREY